jgi:hypothetical protein
MRELEAEVRVVIRVIVIEVKAGWFAMVRRWLIRVVEVKVALI